jgi:hypothetical protein
MTVDAYNKPDVTRFYERNGFQFLTDGDTAKHTRAMWFDLLPWKNSLRSESNGALAEPRTDEIPDV